MHEGFSLSSQDAARRVLKQGEGQGVPVRTNEQCSRDGEAGEADATTPLAACEGALKVQLHRRDTLPF